MVGEGRWVVKGVPSVIGESDGGRMVVGIEVEDDWVFIW